jgi:hypothetical protein
MAASTLFWIGLGWWAITTLVQWLSAALALWRRAAPPSRHKAADFSIVAPLRASMMPPKPISGGWRSSRAPAPKS